MKFIHVAILVLTAATVSMSYYTLPLKEWAIRALDDEQTLLPEDLKAPALDLKEVYEESVQKAFENETEPDEPPPTPKEFKRELDKKRTDKNREEDVPEIQANPFAN